MFIPTLSAENLKLIDAVLRYQSVFCHPDFSCLIHVRHKTFRKPELSRIRLEHCSTSENFQLQPEVQARDLH